MANRHLGRGEIQERPIAPCRPLSSSSAINKNKGTPVPLFLSITSYVQPSVIPPYRKLEACKGRSAGNDKTTPFLRRVKSMWAHRLLRKAYCEFSGEGCVCCLFLQEKNGAKVSYQTLSIINRHTHPPSLTHRSPGCMRSDEDGVHARSGAASVVFFRIPN